MSIHRPTVLILASDPDFGREITSHWPHEPAHSDRPEFIVLDEGFSLGLQGSNYDLAIADASCVEKRNEKPKPQDNSLHQDLRQSLLTAGKPAILIHSDPSRDFFDIQGVVTELRREPRLWPAIAGLVGREILRRRQAESHARAAENTCTAAQAEATLGRYMVEMRTNVNNALTTVLGNAELLVQEPGLPATVHAQAEAIRSMALRLHEIFQRFSSIEKELNVANRQSAKQAAHSATGSR
jgi:hypothetical protein